MERGPEVGKTYKLKSSNAKGIVDSVNCVERTAVMRTASTNRLWSYPVAWSQLEKVK